MEIGMGFWLGAFVGIVVAVIVGVVIIVSRRAMSGGAGNTARHGTETIVRPAPSEPPATRGSVTRVLPSHSAHSAHTASKAPGASAAAQERKELGGHTMIVEEFESRDRQLSASIQEVRDLLLTLAGVISRTEAASGKATDAFQSAKTAINGLAASQSPEIQEAQRLLLSEIDRVLATNATLHSELDNANKGIAEQRLQIEELRVQARVDALTRVPNRAAFDERLQEYVSLFERTALVFSLLLVDIDHFKRVNDDHGHVSGDRILRGIAQKISASIRGNDFVARYGGEEFAVIFPGSTVEEALTVSDRIRADIAKTNFRMDQKTLKITISGGIAQCHPSMDPTHLIAAADKALYRAKNTGRNRILPAGEEGEEG
jgi:diguanylate cyclase (GGDEF)-like protein